MIPEKELLEMAAVRYRSKLNVLVLDDDEDDRIIIQSLLISPLYKVYMAGSLGEAEMLVKNFKHPWACWLVDMKLGDESGIDFMSAHPQFPFKVVISGLGSMQEASEAVIRGGAKAVFDKGSVDFISRGGYVIDRIAALGFILNGTCHDHLDIFFSLPDKEIRSVSQWSDETSKVRRRLEQVCGIYAGRSPKQCLDAFWAIQHVLGETGLFGGRNQYGGKEERQFAVQCLESFLMPENHTSFQGERL